MTDQQAPPPRPDDVAVVIPTLAGDPLTLDSIPEGVETVVVSEGNRAEARNIGAARTTGDILVFCDDDIAFEESFFWKTVGDCDQGTLTGLVDFDFGLLLTRYLVVRRSDFERLGGFDQRLNHMEDTEFCLRAVSADIAIETIPRDAVSHEDHESVGQGRLATLRAVGYLCLRYPRWSPRLLKGLVR